MNNEKGQTKKKNNLIKRLVLAKKLYLHGCYHAKEIDQISRMLAIHHFDNAVEIVLKCIATKQGIEPERKYFSFEELLDKIKDLPLKEEIRNLHSLRNHVQHSGDVPSIEPVIKYKGYVEDFFRKVCERFFPLPYEELRLASLIENENLKEKVTSAEEAFEKERYRECIELCNNAFIAAVNEEFDLPYKAGLLTGLWGGAEDLAKVIDENYAKKYQREPLLYELAKDLSKAIRQLGKGVSTMQFLDEYKMDFLNHMETVKNLTVIPESELKDRALLSLNFITDVILKWQEEGILKV